MGRPPDVVVEVLQDLITRRTQRRVSRSRSFLSDLSFFSFFSFLVLRSGGVPRGVPGASNLQMHGTHQHHQQYQKGVQSQLGSPKRRTPQWLQGVPGDAGRGGRLLPHMSARRLSLASWRPLT